MKWPLIRRVEHEAEIRIFRQEAAYQRARADSLSLQRGKQPDALRYLDTPVRIVLAEDGGDASRMQFVEIENARGQGIRLGKYHPARKKGWHYIYFTARMVLQALEKRR